MVDCGGCFSIEFWASSLGSQLVRRCDNASGIKLLQQVWFYLLLITWLVLSLILTGVSYNTKLSLQYYNQTENVNRRKIRSVNGTELVLSSARRIEDYLQVRYNAVLVST